MNERVDQKNIYMLLSALKELKRLDIFMPPYGQPSGLLLVTMKTSLHGLILVPPPYLWKSNRSCIDSLQCHLTRDNENIPQVALR
jgi:hypothetical protein